MWRTKICRALMELAALSFPELLASPSSLPLALPFPAALPLFPPLSAALPLLAMILYEESLFDADAAG